MKYFILSGNILISFLNMQNHLWASEIFSVADWIAVNATPYTTNQQPYTHARINKTQTGFGTKSNFAKQIRTQEYESPEF